MDEPETNSEETNVEIEGGGDSRTPGFEPFDCCRSMVERMIRAFEGRPVTRAGAREGAVDSDFPDRCKAMMARMMKGRGERRERDGESRDEEAGACCGNPG